MNRSASPATLALLDRVRAALASAPDVEEKRAFGGLMFMVRGKMCMSVRDARMMFRIDPAVHDTLLPRAGCATVVMKGRSYRGYVRVEGDALRRKKEFDFWVALALAYNQTAAAPVRKKRT